MFPDHQAPDFGDGTRGSLGPSAEYGDGYGYGGYEDAEYAAGRGNDDRRNYGYDDRAKYGGGYDDRVNYGKPKYGGGYDDRINYGKPMSGKGMGYNTLDQGGSDMSLGDDSDRQRNVTLLVFAPLAIYTVSYIVFALSGPKPWTIWLAIGFLVMGALLFFRVPMCGMEGSSRLYPLTGFLCLFSVCIAAWQGSGIHARFFHPYYGYATSPTYTNVLPSDLASARADAAIIGFDSQAVVDTFRAGSIVSFDLSTFCVAPIFDESGQTRAEFWAVGVDCCGKYGGFYCDDALDITCKSGLVIRDENSSFAPPVYGKYLEAVKATAAKNQVQIPDRPVLLRWKNNPEDLMGSYLWNGIVHIVVGVLFYTLLCFVIGFIGATVEAQREKRWA